jgi:hypothetical protein
MGTFHEWQDGTSQRRDERLGLRTEHQLRVGEKMWIQNANGQIREITGIAARRQITEDFIDSETFAKHMEDVTFLEAATLPDGRHVYRLEVQPRGGEPYFIGIDTTTWLLDEKSYIDNDSVTELYYDDYHVVDGFLVPYKEVESNGTNPAYDVTSVVEHVTVNQPIAASVFAPLNNNAVAESAPVVVPVSIHKNLPFVDVTLSDHTYHFLVDSGSQRDVIDTRVASELGLHPEGTVEIIGAARVRALGAVELPPLHVGGAVFTSQLATVFQLGQIPSDIRIDGVLGEPFFQSSELRFDPDKNTLTIAQPGTLPALGDKLDVDTDRELIEMRAKVNRTADTRVVVDTGNAQEVLVYQSFLAAHPNVVNYAGSLHVQNQGAGGSTNAVATIIEEVQIGNYHLFNRYGNVILENSGAFADKIDGGNIGYPTIHNFIDTFDIANHALYLARAGSYDDGRGRAQIERLNPLQRMRTFTKAQQTR